MLSKQLVTQPVIAADRPLQKLRKPGYKQKEVRVVLLCRVFSPVDINQVRYGLERIERNTQRQNQSAGAGPGRKQRIPVFQIREYAEVDQKTRCQNQAFALEQLCAAEMFYFL